MLLLGYEDSGANIPAYRNDRLFYDMRFFPRKINAPFVSL